MPATDSLTTTVPAAVELGWSMATLYTPPDRFGMDNVDHLRTEHELPANDRITVELKRIGCLLKTLSNNSVSVLDATNRFNVIQGAWTEAGPPTGDNPAEAPRTALHGDLPSLNLTIFQVLACATNQVELAYQVGRSLRDTSSLPKPLADLQPTETQRLLAALAHDRVSTLQQWLETLAPYLPQHTAALVSTSLGRWSELAGAALDKDRPGQLRRGTAEESVKSMKTYLLRQGDVWLQLLTGTQSTDGLLPPEGYVAAGELALQRTARIIRQIVLHYWVALVVLAIALGAVLYFTSTLGTSPGKVWTQIAAVAASLGVTARGIGSTAARLAKEAERPIFGLEEEDVMAWAITALPPVRLTHGGVRALRRAGVTPSVRMKRTALKGDQGLANQNAQALADQPQGAA
jgi:hypothetical protein